ncbi:MAG: uracil-DNA glycosylase [Alphaproteobacteria bacterium]
MSGADHLLSLLRWQIEAGADEAIAETPVDRRSPPRSAETATIEKVATAPAPPAAPSRSPAPPAAAAAELPGIPAAASATSGAHHNAYTLAAAAQTLGELRAALEAFDECALKHTATNMVLADGNPEAAVVLIGEAPGAEEDRLGLPFVGKAGRLLDRMLAAIGRDRGSAYITNILFWRPPGNRQPTAAEIAACLPFVERHIELLSPEVLVFLGGTAAKTLLARNEGIMRLRGRWFEYSSPGLARPVAAMATFHPAYLLRSPGQKRAAWQDLLDIKAKLEALAQSHGAH